MAAHFFSTWFLRYRDPRLPRQHEPIDEPIPEPRADEVTPDGLAEPIERAVSAEE
jgi:hypothetical protein